MIKLLIADDHALFREGLKRILSDTFGVCVIDEAVNGQEVINKVAKNNYDIVLLDISMPGRSGLDVLSSLKNEYPGISVLILSMHPEERYAVRALKLGADGYITKNSVPEELIKVIKKIISGGKYFSESFADRLYTDLQKEIDEQPHQKLSEREYEVICYLASGKSVKEIADELFLSVPTISTYRARIMEKMNMKKNSELTFYTIKNNLID